MTSSAILKQVFNTARPLIESWLDVAEQIAALRDAATAQGLDWSQVKALLKAQIQDERDRSHRRVNRIIERAEFASAYADMLGLGCVNEKNFSTGQNHINPPDSPNEVSAPEPPAPAAPQVAEESAIAPPATASFAEMPDLPPFLDRRARATAEAAA